MGTIGAAQVGATGSPSPDPAPCPGGGAKPWARPVPPHAAVLEGTWSPSSFGLCCEEPTMVPREMALAAMGVTREHGVALALARGHGGSESHVQPVALV